MYPLVTPRELDKQDEKPGGFSKFHLDFNKQVAIQITERYNAAQQYIVVLHIFLCYLDWEMIYSH